MARVFFATMMRKFSIKEIRRKVQRGITTLLRIMSLFYHPILPKQIEMASLLFIQSELPDEVMTDEVFRVVARGQPSGIFHHTVHCSSSP